MNKMSVRTSDKAQSQAGFTVLELVIVIISVLIIGAIVLFTLH